MIDGAFADRLDQSLERDLQDNGRLGLPKRYLDGKHDMPYIPKRATLELMDLQKKSITNWCSLVPETFAKGLFVDGYRAPKASDNAAIWAAWQANNLDARQSLVYRGALNYGASFVLTLPGKIRNTRTSFMRPLSPLRSDAWFEDDDDEFPEFALRRIGKTIDGTRLIQIIDNVGIHQFAMPKDEHKWLPGKSEEHGLGVTPITRFRQTLDGESQGVITPLIPLMDRINNITFDMSVAMKHGAFRQRWGKNIDLPEDADGNPINPFRSAPGEVWIANGDAQFGDFAQTDISGFLNAYRDAVKSFAAIAQINPNLLTGDLINLSADALAALQDGTQRKIAEYETNFGESWESTLRLAAKASGDEAGANDTTSEVRWRDSSARSMTEAVNALAVQAKELQVPIEALWEKIPGVTDQEITRWKTMRDTASLSNPLNALTAEIARQTGGASAPLALPQPQTPPTEAAA